MTIKLIALDLDGTTLNSEGKVSPYTEKILNKATKQGIHVVIATGRSQSALPEEILKLPGIEYAITSNGAAIIDLRQEKIIYENCIDAEALEEVHKLLIQYDYMVEVFLEGKAYVEKNIFENLEKVGLSERNIKYVRRTRLPYTNVLNMMLRNKGRIENININFSNQEDRTHMRKKLNLLKNVTITSSLEHNLEIGGATTSKASALKELCKSLGIESKHIMACGDSPNDEEMMKVAGIPVAMGNARPSIKKISKYITFTNDEDGVAKAIEKFAFDY